MTWISRIKKNMNENIFFSKLKFQFWLAGKLLFNKQMLYGGSAPLSFLGLVLGVAALVTSMSVMRGFESSLSRAMIDVTGDIQVVKKGRLIEDANALNENLINFDPRILKTARFSYTEAVAASQGKVSGVLLQGLEFDQIDGVLNIQKRLLSGDYHLSHNEIAIGQGLARKFNLKTDDDIYLAVLLPTPFESESFKRQAQVFKVKAIIDFGKNEWNERLVLATLKNLQTLTQIGERYTGLFVKINDSQEARTLSADLADHLGPQYAVMNWYDVNKNLFEAVKIESVVIFFVVFLIVIVAAFNISSTLYVLIRQRYRDIAVLKALGASVKNIQNLFVLQGVWIATVGSLLGFILGFILSRGFMYLQLVSPVISGSVYKIDRIDVQMSFVDLFIIYITTLVTCLIATYSPARKGSLLTVIEGLRKE